MSTPPNDHDLLIRVDENLRLFRQENKADHTALENALIKQDRTDRVSALEGQLHGSWAVFGGLLALVGLVLGLFEYLRGAR